MEGLLNKLSICIERGKEDRNSPYPPDLKDQEGARELTEEALSTGVSAERILQEGLIHGMNKIGNRFSAGKAYIPELLIAAKAMYGAMDVLKPYFESGEIQSKGKVIIGTVAGDLHDIGKNIVRMVLEGGGWQVIDLGVDTTTDKFLHALSDHPGAILGMSALLTTTMTNMGNSVKEIKDRYPKQKIYIGGAPVTEEFCDMISADGYFSDPYKFASYLNENV
jgi:5-methyltetrahydrofolate--homocysteine methyltransferase